MNNRVRVRFAPSPTGGLHLGGVRTALYNYLFAKQHGGDFILRIEDTDQGRFVEGAEQYIVDCLRWCGMEADESPQAGGPYGPYRQSERKEIYRAYAEQLVKAGHAYYAFDTPAELDQMRILFKTELHAQPQYDHHLRSKMRNSLSIEPAMVKQLLQDNTPHTIRIKMPENEDLKIQDLIRGEVNFNTSLVDDKVLLKADGMPTYHLAVVVDDYLMKITHVFRGEEWLPSAPVHIYLWKCLGWESQMPQWAHLPLILKPDGNGKLSKRDAERLGFPIFAMTWTDPRNGETTGGFSELGFLPEAFVNLLALLGWNDGSEKEIFTLDELRSHFSIERVHKGGAKFDFEKAKWFNHEWIKNAASGRLLPEVKTVLENNGLVVQDQKLLERMIELVKDRCMLLPDFYTQGGFFFKAPAEKDIAAAAVKWNGEKKIFFEAWMGELQSTEEWNQGAIESGFKALAEKKNIKPGELLLPLRIMLVGGKFGPAVFDIIPALGREETIQRVHHAVHIFEKQAGIQTK